MRRGLIVLALALLAGCATTGGQTPSQDSLDKTKTGAAAGALYGLAACGPFSFIPAVGVTCAGVGALYGGGAGAVWDHVEGEDAAPQNTDPNKPFVGPGS